MKVAMASTFGYFLRIQQKLSKIKHRWKKLIHDKNNDNLWHVTIWRFPVMSQNIP